MFQTCICINVCDFHSMIFFVFLLLFMASHLLNRNPREGSLASLLATHPCPKKKSVEVVSFKRGVFFILHRTLGVPRNKMLETLIHNAILMYLSQHHNN